ncbi:hypothetical protein evm_001559 [Chilo suppressalis]|nr:hypothetical protein evm_001559 [Chilo suppressalis]
MLVLVLSLFGLFQSSVGQIVQIGQCDPNIQLQETFDYQSNIGSWYELRTSETDSGECSNYEFGAGNNVTRSAVNENFEQTENGTLSIDNTNTAKLTITWSSSEPQDFWVLSSSNIGALSFIVGYKCINITPTQRSVSLWVLSQQQTIGAIVWSNINSTLLSRLGISVDELREVSRSENACYVLPIIEPGNPVILPGQCNDNITAVQNFDVANFSGLWHEVASYYSENSENRCARAQYTVNSGVVEVVNSQVVNQALQIITGTATVVSTDGSARLSVSLLVNNQTVTQDLVVLATDYSNYAVSYTCVNINNDTKRVFSWILSRRRQLSEQAQAAVNDVIASEITLNNRYFRQSDQSDEGCFFFPVPIPGVPVVYRGSCNASIAVVQDFDPTRYMGTWHDIESYPSVFQTGTCRNANYELTDVVEVFNTQVIDQSLDTMTGFAVLDSDDGSAKLKVTFPVAGTNETVTTDYWVISTDYDSYALVYTCLELPATEEKIVWSWKLSRSKQLLDTAAANITAAMADVPVLDQRYFEQVDQSPEGCFYFPNPQPGIPVVFPGQCDNNVNVVQNFNFSRFAGSWIEIESYPKEEQQGQCIRHEYTYDAGNMLNMQSVQIVDQFQQITTGNLTLANNNNNSARLTITLDSGIQIPFWILATDYDSYALAYSCVDRGDDFRAIYSWKLSRTTELSPAANTSITNAMANVQVLSQEYFERIDQSLNACFYLPELAPGEPIILVGQCDPNIPVKPNFNASAYLGRWRLIESYPSEFQNGTCTDATYILNADGASILVRNTEVVNEILSTMEGQATILDNAKLLVTFPNAPQPLEYWVLDTDYSSYALVYSCANIDNERRRVWSWKMSRTRSLTQEAGAAINATINTINVLNNAYYQQISHSDVDCFYFPEPSLTPPPVRFRGRCDPNIAVVPNFNVTAYLGLWHTIEQYPSWFQQGTCGNAEYSAIQEGVNVFNTQVIDQTLDTITGLAVTASDDGSAKLDVTFPVANTTQNVTTSYWVLATDYDSYSLVYTCVEIDDEYKNVFSWKLSRTKQLSEPARNEINSITSRIQILDNRYYNEMDQSPEGCFFYPEPQPGMPVVFPGRCSNDSNVVQNFNMSQFSGPWFEIQAYPIVEVERQCVNHDYIMNTTTSMNVQYLQVFQQSLIESTGTLNFASNDSSARMTITINVNGIDTYMPFWIISTDYDDYALAYSCTDNEDDTRTVYSWKLSRSQELSQSADTQINEAMSNVDVLRQEYYEDIDQSPAACFYLPDIPLGVPVTFRGSCDPNITVVQNFSAADYLGPWNLIETYHSDFQFGSCQRATYSLNANNTVDVTNTQVVNETLLTMIGEASVIEDGKLLVTFPGAPEPIEYWVLDTDYTSYSLVYSCRNIAADRRQVWSWKLSRGTELSVQATNNINAVIETVNVLANRYYQRIGHEAEDCFYFPEPDPMTPVRFRGTCDPNIQVVSNFNASGYLGLWHNIEHYPSVFQTGTCSNALYSSIAEGVEVFNTQVMNQTLDTMTGLAVVASEDGSGKLDVTFPVVGTNLTTTMSYWILATDYTSYSLVYTCAQLGPDERVVYSWKLSRTKELSEEAHQVINNVTSSIQVLQDRYYLTVDQSPEGCFYFPDPQPGIPVVFPGRCDNDINVVQNFSLSSFEGIWHEIEAYPKEQQQGQCINHEFSSGTANALNLQSTQVSDLNLGVNTGVVSFSSTDGSARMILNMTVDGEVIVIPYWILSTDYSSYALAYSCLDLENDHRAVYSWKLSRNRTLSDAARDIISDAMNPVDVLSDEYFERIDQSDDACFYLPNLAPGDPVIFRGQCNDSITGVPNFNVNAYLGLWRSVQTYQSEFQNGTCIQATYIPSEEGVIVYNTQVINQTLDTINGTAVVGSTDGSGLLLVSFPTTPVPARYYVLATDYISYALVYSCRNLDSERRQVWSWKLSRDRELSATANVAINAVMDTINVLDNRYFEHVPQTQDACFYYPEPNNQSISFRGQCSENVTVVQNFNATRYQGIWYDIESFPQNFQFGTCPIAEYTLNGDVVDVYNTQVVAQQLDEIRATAVLASDDGSAKLDVTFPVAGTNQTVTMPYWVLATDYDNYALVYSCENIEADRYRVTSWKLSREKAISEQSSVAFANAQSNVKELLDKYYIERGHSDDDCLFYPDNNGGPVILDGQCENPNDVVVVTGFDSNRFNGTWYEIERFPSNIQNGECVENEFTSNQNGFAVSKRIIYNERLSTFTGIAALNQGDRGVFSVNLSNGDTTIIGNVFVLDTDYEDYALLYSCRNVDSERKQVYSWKLSRSQSGLSQNANTNIDVIVNERRDLFFKYYERTGQDSDACFYYPVFDGQQSSIILPGSCETLSGVPNFNAAMYLGRWFEISSYPDPNQFGECSRAHYSPGNGVVDVTNTQVVNRTLLSQVGFAAVASTDGSGILFVTFVVGGVSRTATYHILDTDYTSYSLVYSCRDLNDGRREVFSWKLSRTKSLTPDANTAINNVINVTRGLLEDYYEPTSQSDEDCFYVPEFVPDQAMQFRGRCERFTGTFQNFEPQRYLNKRWHEIKRYPSDVNGGNCVSTRYQSTGNTITFEGTRVFGINDGRVTTGTATMNANGRIDRTYADGTTETVWVLATDYDSYSLLLACEDIDDEYMRVWSAKHSSTRSLSAGAETALAPVIANNDLLYDNMFVAVSQTDAACFYYPQQDGQSVVIPGQCDDNIPTQQDFDLTSYLGTWYQIERYPYPEISAESTCIGTRYTSRGDDTAHVLNWETNNGTFNTIEGEATLRNGSAVLTVVLRPDPENPEAVTTTDLHVLTTDYASYSLVYTCENVDQYHRVVVAVKLSRTRNLPDSAQSAINNFMATREELHQPYFIRVEQNDECEDPSSSYLIKSSIIVTLLCLIIQALV